MGAHGDQTARLLLGPFDDRFRGLAVLEHLIDLHGLGKQFGGNTFNIIARRS